MIVYRRWLLFLRFYFENGLPKRSTARGQKKREKKKIEIKGGVAKAENWREEEQKV